MSFRNAAGRQTRRRRLSRPSACKRLTDTLKRDIDKGTVPGAVVLIARRGKIACHEALGYRDREAGAAMAVDTIFRIASMTKPFTSVAAMMLAEEGKLLDRRSGRALSTRIRRAQGRGRLRQCFGEDARKRAAAARR